MDRISNQQPPCSTSVLWTLFFTLFKPLYMGAYSKQLMASDRFWPRSVEPLIFIN